MASPSGYYRLRVTSWTPGIKPSWTVGQVRSALRDHADGNFASSAQLIDAMGEDDELPGALEKWVDALLQSDFELRPVTEEGDGEDKPIPASERIAEQLGPMWWDMVPEADLDEWLRWYRMLGVGLATIDYERTAGFWKPRLRTLHPQFLYWDDEARQYLYQAREGLLPVIPGDGKWALLTDGHRGWMRAGVRALAVTWLSKQFAIRDWNRYNERHGLPIIKAHVPVQVSEPERDEFLEDLRALQTETAVELPNGINEDGTGFDLGLLEAKDGSWQTFKSLLERCDRKFQVYLTGGNLGSEVVDQGARAAADTHRGVAREKATSLAQKAATELRRQVVAPVAALNFAGATIDVAPWPTWDTEPPEDTKTEAEAQKTLGEALAAIKTAGYEVTNLVDVAAKHGLELEEREEPDPPPMPPPMQPGQQPMPPDPEQQAEDDAAQTEMMRLARDDDQRGYRNGNQYVDRLVTEATTRAAESVAWDVADVLRVIQAAQTPQDLKAGLALLYQGMSPERLGEVFEKARLLAELAGRYSVIEDVASG